VSKRPYKVYAGDWLRAPLGPHYFVSSHATAASAMNKASKVIQEGREKKALGILSPVYAKGPKGVVIWLYLDDNKQVKRKKL
jgi:hypothetical protein